jgi:hypothetical protein
LNASYLALTKIATTDDIRNTLNIVLLAIAYILQTVLVTVRRDLHHDGYTSISFDSLQDVSYGGNIWSAYTLVTYVLLPLAQHGIVHVDLRLEPKKSESVGLYKYNIYNILGRCHNGSYDMILIDFDSLQFFTSANITLQDYAISPILLAQPNAESACYFLFWQVLWMAYGLYFNYVYDPSIVCPVEDLTVCYFVTTLLQESLDIESNENPFKHFRDWIGSVALLELANIEKRLELSNGTWGSISKQVSRDLADTLSTLLTINNCIIAPTCSAK